MKDFNIPDDTIISSLISLFSSTMIQINVNRFLTDAFQQHGELRQGDSISPLLLFNIAFDPLLRAIDNSPAIQNKLTTTDIPSPVKIIAYADGTLVTLSQPEDFHQLQAIQARYINAFNAKLTYDKTQVLLLSGALPVTSLPPSNHSIQHWHDLTSQDPLMYLWKSTLSNGLLPPSLLTAMLNLIAFPLSILHNHTQYMICNCTTSEPKQTLLNGAA
ncbi:hypothetical protein G6F42_017557 [Rhizopus arrhizus]|nr:hypothetical protein G6F42_017557 [Rhizopus arrhizus]